jgi:hypothetical protein
MTKVAAVAVLAAAASSAQAVDLNNGDVLTITTGVYALDGNGNATNVSSGSFFAMDLNADSKVQGTEKTSLSQGTTGITIGASNTALGEITAAWPFSGATGYDWVSTAITGGTGGLNMSGWTVNWNGGNIDMGAGGAWQVLNAASGMPTSGYANSTAIFSWDGVYGSTYTLDYTATVPSGGFIGTQYALHLTGTVAAAPVPEASTYGMMLAGLGLVGFAVRRRKMVA